MYRIIQGLEKLIYKLRCAKILNHGKNNVDI